MKAGSHEPATHRAEVQLVLGPVGSWNLSVKCTSGMVFQMRPHCCVGSPTTRPGSTGRAVRHRTQDPAVPARGGRALTGRRASINGHWGSFAADGRARGWPRMSSLADADASIPTMSVQVAAPGQRGPPRNPMNPTATPTYDRKWPDPQAGRAERSSTRPPTGDKGLAQGSPLAAPGKRQSKEEVPVLSASVAGMGGGVQSSKHSKEG